MLPLPAGDHYTYSIPSGLAGKIVPGVRAIVPFGKAKFHTGIVTALHDRSSKEDIEYREVAGIADDRSVVSPEQLAFWRWVSDYYLCPPGEVYRAAIPSVMRPSGESAEIVSGQLKPPEETFVRLADRWKKAGKEEISSAVGRAPRQQQLLETYLGMAGGTGSGKGILKTLLLSAANATTGILNGLTEKGILESFRQSKQRIPPAEVPLGKPVVLSEIQLKALSRIKELFGKHETVLLHGVAASGKTEIYMHLIREELKAGRTVLYLLPEIALTTQIVVRLQRVFGERVGVYHSGYTDIRRSELYEELLHDDSRTGLVIGARSAIFLPVNRIGLIIVDEEHDASFKQAEPAPRYHARDAALMLSSMAGCRVLLGSSTPSLETYFNARNGKYGLVELKERYLQYRPPEIILADLKEAYRKKKMHAHFTPLLRDKIREHLNGDRQVILFQNRRGYAPFMQCLSCGHIPVCKHCDVSLTYHHRSGNLQCHYCGYREAPPRSCKNCGSREVIPKGFGTEQVEDDLIHLFPDAVIGRMDLDTTGTRKKYLEVIEGFESGRIRILVGTQIVTKGLDFGNVGLVGILNADNLFYFPDFRAFERSYQLLAQVAGRAGRREAPGEVVIQTYATDHPVIRELTKGTFMNFYLAQLRERHDFLYPPYTRLIRLTLKHRKKEVVKELADRMANELKDIPECSVLGPQSPVVGRIQTLYLVNILLKFPKSRPVGEERRLLRDVLDSKAYGRLRIIADVDPL